MGKLLIISLGTVFLVSCTTPMERAKTTCYELGIPTPACFERYYNVERQEQQKILDNINQRNREEAAAYKSRPPAESAYDKQVREFNDQAKNNCERAGGVFEKFGNAFTCGSPKVSPPPPQPQKQEINQPSQPDYSHGCGGNGCNW